MTFEVGQIVRTLDDAKCGVITAVEIFAEKTSVSVSWGGIGVPMKMWGSEVKPSPLVVITRQPTDEEIAEAVSIRGHEAFRAMSVANAIGGLQTPVWWLCRNFGILELKAEAKRRGLESKS